MGNGGLRMRFLVLFAAIIITLAMGAGADLLLRPQPQIIQPSEGDFTLTSGCRIVIPKDFPAYIRVSAQELAKAINEASGISPEIVETDKPDVKKGDITIAQYEWLRNRLNWFDAAPAAINRPDPEEGYNMRIIPDHVYIAGNSERGCFMGMQTLIQIVKQCKKNENGAFVLPGTLIADWPNHNWRTLQIHLAHTGSIYDRGQHVYNPVTPAATLVRAIKLAAYSKMSGLVVDVESGMTYERQPENITEGIKRNEKHEIKQAVDLAKSLGLEMVPKSNSSSGHDGWLIPYSFSVPASDSYSDIYMEQLHDAYDEIIEVFRPSHFHVGLDEDVFADIDGRPLRSTAVHKQVLVSNYEYLRRQGITMEVWCDAVTQLQREAVDVPRDVIVHPWYYGGSDFTPAREYVEQGFRILCSPWSCWHVENDQFYSIYAASMKSEKVLGMAGTFWYTVPGDDTDYRRCLVKAAMAFWSPLKAGDYPNDKEYWAPEYDGLPGNTAAEIKPKTIPDAERAKLIALVTSDDKDAFACEAAREKLVAAGTAVLPALLEEMAKTPETVSPWAEGTVRRIVREPVGDKEVMISALEKAAGTSGALRALALEMLGRAGDVEFLSKMDASDPDVCRAMGFSGDKRFLPMLVKDVDAGGMARSYALTAIGQIKGTDELVSFKDRWKSWNQNERYAYARALAMQGDERILPVLGDLARDTDPKVRFQAAIGIGGTRSPKAGSYILKLLDDSDPAVFKVGLWWCTDTFILKPEEYFPYLYRRLNVNENKEIVRPILHAMILMWMPGVGQMLSDGEDPAKRIDYAKLSVWKDKKLISTLNEMSAYPDKRLAADAMIVLLKMGASPKADGLIKLTNSMNVEDQRWFCIRMREEANPAAAPVMKSLWSTGDRLVRTFIIQYAARVKTEETFAMLKEFYASLPKDDEQMRTWTLSAMAAHIVKLDNNARYLIPLMLDTYEKTDIETRGVFDAALSRAAGRKPVEEPISDPSEIANRLAEWRRWWESHK
jgi:HEAT repeat protein